MSAQPKEALIDGLKRCGVPIGIHATGVSVRIDSGPVMFVEVDSVILPTADGSVEFSTESTQYLVTEINKK